MIQLTENTQKNFKVIAKWSRFLGIVNMICAVMIILASYASISFLSYTNLGAMKWLYFLVYLTFGILIFWFSYLLYTSGVKLKEGINFDKQISFDQGIDKLKTVFVVVSYSTIAILAFYVLAIIFMGVFRMSYMM